ncbi:hypothetical protein AJ80_01442 [Polytolypa hystricis UAMH7299]|uniref:SH3 domain-containing protein n=1 Tax=Polytolypa hystricis (strain UAMH7299) TaxID=1447883 RepID=A0A2B7Z0C1_POLH7|nr:hypothetical protein AJ80_01442 [Polytolypa hystricis UAMH7299]
MSEKCVPLKGSTACPAFADASFSTDPSVVKQFPFLSFVSNTKEFDERLSSYVHTDYVKLKYKELMGCSDIDLRNTTYIYARYTTSVICNGIVQSSKPLCSLSEKNSRPLCADTCAQSATSEEMIVVNPDLCGKPHANFMDHVRADFTVCSIPADSLTGTCISGEDNEPQECGFSSNLLGLCAFCATSSANSTDSCCVASDVTSRCEGVVLPTITSLPPLFPTSTSTSTSTNTPAASGNGLSGGQIAGVVVGSVAGVALLAAVAVFLCIFWRRKKNENQPHVLNQPSPRREMASMEYAGGSGGQRGVYETIPGGRVARMSALQGGQEESPRPGGTAGTMYHDSSDSEVYGDSPAARSKRGPPITGRRNGSLSSASVLAGDGDHTSPRSGAGGQFSSPEGVTSGQSEQLPYFRDYYSQDDIHPSDKVAVLWAYQPRAGDEFELDRGDMLKVVGIWDDGWATGVRLNESAEDYDPGHNPQRDSGVSNGSGRRGSSPPPTGEIKAFPLVCVCLPQHWRKTIEGDVRAYEEGNSPP